MTVHEIEEAQPSADFVGLHFDGIGGYVSIKPKRIAKIRSAINELLRLQFCSGRTLQLLLAHCTWAILARREGLALLSSCYASMHQNGDRHCRLWPSVRKELAWVSALLPLMRMRINSGWAKEVTASDSSLWGVGVCHRFLDEQSVRSVGSVSARWRFKFEDATRARDHALLQDHTDEANVVAALLPSTTAAPSSLIRDLGFHEVPSSIMEKQPWSVVWSRPWQFAGNILHTEARALVWSVEHLLRANRCIGRRLVCFSDNLPLVLSATKGRGRSKHLLGPLRKLAALGLASGSKIHTRWISSEVNVADAPSRAVEQWRAARFERWWDDETFRAGETFKKECSASSSAEACHKREAQARRPPVVSGVTKCEASDFDGLSIQDAADDYLAWLRSVPDDEPHSARRNHDRVPRGPVRGREGNRRWDSSSGCTEVFPSVAGKGSDCFTTSDNEGAQRLGSGSPAETEAAYPAGGLGRYHQNSGEQEPQGARLEAFHPVLMLSETGGVLEPSMQAAHTTSADCSGRLGLPSLGHSPAPIRGWGGRQDEHLRRDSPPGLGQLVGSSAAEPRREKTTRRITLELASLIPERPVPRCDFRSGADWDGVGPLQPSSRRSNSRCLVEKKIHARGQTKRSVGSGRFAASLRQASQDAERALKAARQREGVWQRGDSIAPRPLKPPACSNRPPQWNEHITSRMWRQSKAKPPSKPALTDEAFLRFLFKQEIRKTQPRHRRIFLDVFSGCGRIASQLRRRGFACIAIDKCLDPRLDVLNPKILNVMRGWMCSGCVQAIWLATPCSSWSRARHGPCGSAWGPLRDNRHIYGFKGLSSRNQAKITEGNATMRATCEILQLAIKLQIPCFLENPARVHVMGGSTSCSIVSLSFF